MNRQRGVHRMDTRVDLVTLIPELLFTPEWVKYSGASLLFDRKRIPLPVKAPGEPTTGSP